jgi:hypothetical protein
MKSLFGMFAFSGVLALGIAPASADVTNWDAVQWVGTQWDCSGREMNARWRIVESANRIVLQSDSRTSKYSWSLSPRQLNADGSGRISISYHNGRPAWFEFAAGHGPRMIQFNYNYQACVWQLHPV